MSPVLYRMPRILGAHKPVSNLSLGGVRIFADERLDIGQSLELEFFLPDGATVEAAAKVVWIKEMPRGAEAVYDVGMEFVALGEDVREKLKAVLKY